MTKKTQKFTPTDLYQQVTDQLIAALETSTDWVMPWHKAKLKIPQNALTKNPYKGINILSLWMASCEKHYTSPLWGTYKQWQDLGANVRKGEKGHPIVFYKDFETEEKNEETGDSDTVKRFVLRSSSVFNAQQVDGFDLPEEEAPVTYVTPFDPLEHVETFISNTGAPIIHGFFSAFYRVSEDVIAMPNPGRFMETKTGSAKEAYYSTLLHELAHWTGHQSRLNRLIPTARFGSESYALEELIAEITSAFLCAELGITASPRQDHANYIASWLKVLKNDKRAIFYAARQATLAAEFLKPSTTPQALSPLKTTEKPIEEPAVKKSESSEKIKRLTDHLHTINFYSPKDSRDFNVKCFEITENLRHLGFSPEWYLWEQERAQIRLSFRKYLGQIMLPLKTVIEDYTLHVFNTLVKRYNGKPHTVPS